jgi:hypothetical protein
MRALSLLKTPEVSTSERAEFDGSGGSLAEVRIFANRFSLPAQSWASSCISAHPEVGRLGLGGATMILPGETEAALRGRNHAEG